MCHRLEPLADSSPICTLWSSALHETRTGAAASNHHGEPQRPQSRPQSARCDGARLMTGLAVMTTMRSAAGI